MSEASSASRRESTVVPGRSHWTGYCTELVRGKKKYKKRAWILRVLRVQYCAKKNTMYFLYCGNWPPGLNPCFRVATLRSSPRRRDRLRTCKSLANHAAKARIGSFTAACGWATSPSAETPISPDYGRWPRGLFSKKKIKTPHTFWFFFPPAIPNQHMCGCATNAGFGCLNPVPPRSPPRLHHGPYRRPLSRMYARSRGWILEPRLPLTAPRR